MPDALHGRGPTQRFVLAIDTAAGAVSACLLARGASTPFAAESLPMERGHAEALLPLLDRLVGQLSGGFDALERVGVTVGPGSFTGIRVGVAAARALGLACGIPTVGVSTLSALAAHALGPNGQTRIIAAIDARHGAVYGQVFGNDGVTLVEAQHASAADLLRAAGPGPFRLVGSGAPMLAIEAWSQGVVADVERAPVIPDIALVARLALLADPVRSPPKPLYLKPPDATPSARADLPRTLASAS